MFLRHGHVREQCVGLEHHVDRPLVGRHVGDVHAVEQDAPGGGALEAGEHAQQGRLAWEPEPPSRAKISPLLMVSETSSTATVSSNFLVTRSILTSTSLGCWLPSRNFLVGAGGNGHFQNSRKDKSCPAGEAGQ